MDVIIAFTACLIGAMAIGFALGYLAGGYNADKRRMEEELDELIGLHGSPIFGQDQIGLYHGIPIHGSQWSEAEMEILTERQYANSPGHVTWLKP